MNELQKAKSGIFPPQLEHEPSASTYILYTVESYFFDLFKGNLARRSEYSFICH